MADELAAAMDRHAEGDPAAFAEVYDLLAPRLYRYLVRQTRDPLRAEDLVQQTLLQIHSAREVYARGSDVLPWAFCIARRLLVDARRRTRKEVLFDRAQQEAEALDLRVERFAVPEQQSMTRELAERAAQVLAAMPEPQREAWFLLRVEGRSLADAAAVLGTTSTAVKLRAHRAYEALRAALAIG